MRELEVKISSIHVFLLKKRELEKVNFGKKNWLESASEVGLKDLAQDFALRYKI